MMISTIIMWGHPIPPNIIIVGLMLALLFTGLMVWLFTREFEPELEKEPLKRPLQNPNSQHPSAEDEHS